MLHVCLYAHLVILHVQKIAMYNANYHQTWYEYSTNNVQYSIIRVHYKNTVEAQYRPDQLHTLDPGYIIHLSCTDGMWLIARMLADGA